MKDAKEEEEVEELNGKWELRKGWDEREWRLKKERWKARK